jgi:hypothetical protein
MKNSKPVKDAYFKQVPGSGFRQFRNDATGETVATMAEAIAKNDQVELVDAIRLADKINDSLAVKKPTRMKPSTSHRSLNPIISFNNATGIDELLKIRKQIAEMKLIDESKAREYQNRYVQRYDSDLDKGIGSLEEHNDF